MMSSVDCGGEDSDAYESLANAIVAAVAEQEGTDPAKLDASLYNTLDPDALNALFAPTTTGHARSGGYVEFTYCGYDVTAYSDGYVSVQALTDTSAAGSPPEDTASDD